MYRSCSLQGALMQSSNRSGVRVLFFFETMDALHEGFWTQGGCDTAMFQAFPHLLIRTKRPATRAVIWALDA